MANPEHLAKLKEGVEAWNVWTRENPAIVPDFQRADLKEVNLQGADLLVAHLQHANLGAANLQGANLMVANLQHANLEVANLQHANLFEANLRGADLRGANLEGVNATNIQFNRWARYQGIRVATCYGSQRFKRFAQDQDFIEEFRSVWWRRPIYWLWLILADCGRSLWPWLCWSTAMAIGYGVKFYSMGKGAFELRHLAYSLKSMIYYSVVTFTTLGFGDIVPKTEEAAMWVMAEVITGYIMLGGLISIFATKLARRS